MSENMLEKKFDMTTNHDCLRSVLPTCESGWLKNCIILKNVFMRTIQENLFEEREDEQDSSSAPGKSLEATEDDGTPVLDEEDLEENDLSIEDAEDIEWEEPGEGEK